MKLPMTRQENKPYFNKLKLSFAFALSLSCPTMVSADAQSGKTIAPLKPEMPYLFVVHNGRSIKVERDIYDSYKARTRHSYILIILWLLSEVCLLKTAIKRVPIRVPYRGSVTYLFIYLICR